MGNFFSKKFDRVKKIIFTDLDIRMTAHIDVGFSNVWIFLFQGKIEKEDGAYAFK